MAMREDLERLLDVFSRAVRENRVTRYLWEGPASITTLALGCAEPLFFEKPAMRVFTTAAPAEVGKRKPKAVAYRPEFRAKRRRLLQAIVEGEGDSTASVISLWAAILELNLKASKVGTQLVREQERSLGEIVIGDMLRDVFSRKSEGTLRVRATAMLLFVKWHTENVSGDNPALPLKEEEVYDYFCFLRREKKPSSRANSLMEAWGFCIGVLGYDDCHDVRGSARCLGAAHRMSIDRKPRTRKAAILVVAIAMLEYGAVFSYDAMVRAALGFCCLLLYGRLRCSDGNLLASLEANDAYAEGALLGGKTSKSKEFRVSLLPAVVPLHGVTGLDWFMAFTEARRSLGLKDFPCETDVRNSRASRPFLLTLPSFRKGELRAMAADEVSGHLVAFLRSCCGLPAEFIENVASHSLKATLLTATGKYGTPITERQLLGYHAVLGAESALNYNRDNLGQPMESLTKVIKEMGMGFFKPDNSRGSRRMPVEEAVTATKEMEKCLGMDRIEFASRLGGAPLSYSNLRGLGAYSMEEELDGLMEAKITEAKVLGQSSSGESESSEASNASTADALTDTSDEDAEGNGDEEAEEEHQEGFFNEEAKFLGEVMGGRARKTIPDHADRNVVWQHFDRGTVHYGRKGNAKRLACGKELNDRYVPYTEDPELAWPRCAKCLPE